MNQSPEQIARDNIDRQLITCGWVIQDKKELNLSAGLGVAVKEYQSAEYAASKLKYLNNDPLPFVYEKYRGTEHRSYSQIISRYRQ